MESIEDTKQEMQIKSKSNLYIICNEKVSLKIQKEQRIIFSEA